uniref:Reverse transcriptase domain-containing protein n=1 Tax=Tanacetum cinerariifolium TaxID=118510 RepID=A0A6L2L5B3_TANCI|nr:reverse transcriptase domain-containing protein [Tanacetum cinerariifolium]
MNAGEFPEMDPYEEVAQQRQVYPLSHAYVPDLIELDEHVPVYVSEPEHPEYHAPSNDDIQVKDEDKDLEEDASEEHVPEDDDEDPEEDPNEEHEHTKEPSEDSDKTEPFEEDETAVTPPPPRHRGARISIRPQTPMASSTQALIDAFTARSPPFLLPPTSPAYDQAPLGHRVAMIRIRDDIPEEDMRPQRRFVLTAPSLGCDVAESFAAAAAKTPRGYPGHDARTITRAADRAEDVGYVRALHASERRMMTSIEEVNLRVSYQAQVCRQESVNFYTQLLDARTNRRDIRLEIDVRQSVEDLTVTQMIRIHALEARAQTDMVEDASSSCVVGLSQWLEKMESVFHIHGCAIDNQVKFATCTLLGAALTWWNDHVRALGEIKKLEIKLWNLRVKGNDVASYTQRFQELVLMCTKFLSGETKKVDKYISRLPDNIHGNIMYARPKALDETIELANELMDQKLRTCIERQNDNKRKADDSLRNNQQQ